MRGSLLPVLVVFGCTTAATPPDVSEDTAHTASDAERRVVVREGVVPEVSTTLARADVDRDGFPAVAEDGLLADCDDRDASIYPGAPDPFGDDVDANCDGTDGVDGDGDGWAGNASTRADCDDADAGVHPGVYERSGSVCVDGVDNDCDGVSDEADPGCPQPPRCGGNISSCGGYWPVEDVTRCSGVIAGHAGHTNAYEGIGTAWGDVDNDGWVDLYTTHNNGPNVLYRNLGDGTFALFPYWVDLALAEEVSGGATFADVDNDGWTDLYVVQNGVNRLFRNLGGTGFEDITASAGVGDPLSGRSAGWGDFDGDGDLDLYVANHGCSDCGDQSLDDVLYRNNGDGTFTDATHLLDAAYLGGLSFIGTWVDIDDDGDVDLWVAVDKGRPTPTDQTPIRRNVLWRNDGPGCGDWCFTEVARDVGAAIALDSMGIGVGDLDGDLDLDLLTTDIGTSRLLRNDQGTFVDTMSDVLDVHAGAGWGIAARDLDNDGVLEVLVAVDRIASGWESLIYKRRTDGTYQIHSTSDFSRREDAYSVALADYDRDGRLDLIGGYATSYGVFHNRMAQCAPDTHWWAIRLRGGGPVNRDAVGTRVDLTRTDGVVLRRDVVLGNSLGVNHDLALHFGLADADIASVAIRWPDGTRETLTQVERDREMVHHHPLGPPPGRSP